MKELLHEMYLAKKRVYFAYRHSIRSGRTSVKEFLEALYQAHEVFPG